MQEVHDEFGVDTQIVTDLSVPRGLHLIAREMQAGLIVVGSTGRGRAGRVLVGSTAERLIQGSPLPRRARSTRLPARRHQDDRRRVRRLAGGP